METIIFPEKAIRLRIRYILDNIVGPAKVPLSLVKRNWVTA